MGGASRDDRARRDTRRRRGLSGLIKRSFSLAGHRTSVALEPEFWAALGRLAAARRQSLSALVATADAGRDPVRPLASALRVLALIELPLLTPDTPAAAGTEDAGERRE